MRIRISNKFLKMLVVLFKELCLRELPCLGLLCLPTRGWLGGSKIGQFLGWNYSSKGIPFFWTSLAQLFLLHYIASSVLSKGFPEAHSQQITCWKPLPRLCFYEMILRKTKKIIFFQSH